MMLSGKEYPYNAGDAGSIPGSGRCPGERNGNPLQYSCLGYLMNRGAWLATVHGSQRVGHNSATEQDHHHLWASFATFLHKNILVAGA